MNTNPPVPTLLQRQALAECREKHAKPLTFAERRVAIETYRSLSWSDDWQGAPGSTSGQEELAKPYVGPFVTSYLDALSRAEREALRSKGEPVELTTWEMAKAECRTSWQYIVEDYREHPARVTAAVLLLIVLTGIGCVWLAVRQGWLS